MAPSPLPTTEPPTTKTNNEANPSSSKAEKDNKGDTKQADSGLSTQELDKLLAREASALQRDVEVDRILKAFKLNPYDVLGLDTGATPADIKKRYRHLSLCKLSKLIHPDKATHPRATDAFDLLKKAEGELSDQAKRDELDAVILEARAQILKSHSLPIGISDTDPRVLSLVPVFKEQVRARTKDILIDEEVRRRKAVKMNLANEGLEARRKDEEAAAKKRKAEEDARWEETRDERVGSWRTFNSGKKKKKTKPNVLG